MKSSGVYVRMSPRISSKSLETVSRWSFDCHFTSYLISTFRVYKHRRILFNPNQARGSNFWQISLYYQSHCLCMPINQKIPILLRARTEYPHQFVTHRIPFMQCTRLHENKSFEITQHPKKCILHDYFRVHEYQWSNLRCWATSDMNIN